MAISKAFVDPIPAGVCGAGLLGLLVWEGTLERLWLWTLAYKIMSDAFPIPAPGQD